MAVDMKAAYRRLFDEAFGKGNFDVFDEVCDNGYRAHDPLTGDADLATEKETCRGYKTAFPDLSPTILGCYADGDTCVVHWRMIGTHQNPLMGIQPTGKRCTVEGMSIGRFRNGKLAEEWAQWDALGLMRQLGAAPSIGAPESSTSRASQPRPHA
ncbi:MAG TPA: ester cyclase [Anaeromyxobacteraceae bacterium]|nr:ester cyclase [Anaeromyxobacteraceae bacterium]